MDANTKEDIMGIISKYIDKAVVELQEKKYYGSIDIYFFNHKNEKVLSGYHFVRQKDSRNCTKYAYNN